jgi:hypothetical protein
MVGFLTFDSSLHFYNLKPSLSAPQMMVVGELEEPFLPLPEDLLVNLKDSRPLVEELLEGLPGNWAGTGVHESATGPALQVGAGAGGDSGVGGWVGRSSIVWVGGTMDRYSTNDDPTNERRRRRRRMVTLVPDNPGPPSPGPQQPLTDPGLGSNG